MNDLKAKLSSVSNRDSAAISIKFILSFVMCFLILPTANAYSGLAVSTNSPESANDRNQNKESIQFRDDHQRALYSELVNELRCPKCQNQNIADSNAVVAKDMRVKTKQLLDEGYDKQGVIDYMVNRYGQFAHYQPPLTPTTVMLWLLPILFILTALFTLRRRSNESYSNESRQDDNTSDDSADLQNNAQKGAQSSAQTDAQLDAQLEALLVQDDSSQGSESNDIDKDSGAKS
jgi:cytochrome c-type biogenesis protein CcmH